MEEQEEEQGARPTSKDILGTVDPFWPSVGRQPPCFCDLGRARRGFLRPSVRSRLPLVRGVFCGRQFGRDYPWGSSCWGSGRRASSAPLDQVGPSIFFGGNILSLGICISVVGYDFG